MAPFMNHDHEIENEDDQQEGSDEIEALHEAWRRRKLPPEPAGANRDAIF
jgi:hypothetical protein